VTPEHPNQQLTGALLQTHRRSLRHSSDLLAEFQEPRERKGNGIKRDGMGKGRERIGRCEGRELNLKVLECWMLATFGND